MNQNPTVSALQLRGLHDLLDELDADDENDNYSHGQAAADIRAALRRYCTCVQLPHDRRCPKRRAA